MIQRAVGFEFELSSWTSKKAGQPLHKKDDIIDRTSEGFRVEADDAPGGASDVEFVVLASDTRQQARAAVSAAATLATALSKHENETVQASDHGGEQGVTIDVTNSKDAIVQVTAAVPLEHVGAMFGALRGPLDLQGGNTDAAVRSVEAFEKAGSMGHPLKPKLKGFFAPAVQLPAARRAEEREEVAEGDLPDHGADDVHQDVAPAGPG